MTGEEMELIPKTNPQVLLPFVSNPGFVIKEFNPKMLPEAEKVNWWINGYL